MSKLAEAWRDGLYRLFRNEEYTAPLRDAAVNMKLGEWTSALTKAVVQSFKEMGYSAAARGHRCGQLPVKRHEYLSLDVAAFSDSGARWPLPIAVLELENSQADKEVSYSLWKTLCIRADLRAVFCYRKGADTAAGLVRLLQQEVVGSMDLQDRLSIQGDTLIVTGIRGEAATFPYSFFKWWSLDINTGVFRLV
ncbi:MAG: hypothetical protein GTN65_10550 [Armatimonadetes bacterium]|nr:hypothetical protein [Armatimonadota bacterium]NIO97507.1 hypothetical protein [Armatimonadota bacterium]